MQRRRRLTFIRLSSGTVLAITAVGSCEHAPTDGGNVQEERRSPRVLPSSPSPAYTSIGTYSVGGVNASGSTTDKTSPGPTLPNKKLLYRVTASGTVTATRTPFWNNGPTTPALT